MRLVCSFGDVPLAAAVFQGHEQATGLPDAHGHRRKHRVAGQRTNLPLPYVRARRRCGIPARNGEIALASCTITNAPIAR